MQSSLHFNFESSAFPPVPGEDEETNPGIFGLGLSEWLAEQLRGEGYKVKRLIAEDFGRLIEVAHDGVARFCMLRIWILRQAHGRT